MRCFILILQKTFYTHYFHFGFRLVSVVSINGTLCLGKFSYTRPDSIPIEKMNHNH